MSSSQFVFSFDGNVVVDEPTAISGHWSTSLGVYDGSPFAIGCFYTQHNEVEHFTDSWRSLGQFPFVSPPYPFSTRPHISRYSTVTVENVLYIFGMFNFNCPRFIFSSIITPKVRFTFLVFLNDNLGFRSYFQIYSVFYSGGWDGLSVLDLVAKYDGRWSRAGSLMQRRYAHRSILQGNRIIHIGGGGP